jgi:hypothetical protein
MGERGPDTSFKPEFCNVARRVAMLGATNDDLAAILGVCRRTVGNWLQEFPEFKAAVAEGKLDADSRVAEKLYQRAIGYERPAVRHFAGTEGPQRVDYTYHHPPDTAAAIFWLRNRRREDWREQVEHRHTTSHELLVVLEAARLRARPQPPAMPVQALPSPDDVGPMPREVDGVRDA